MSRKSIYFHIDEIARDAVVAANFRQIMKGFDVDVVYGNRRQIPLFTDHKCTQAFDLFVLPNIDIAKNYWPKSEDMPTSVVILPTESVGGTTGHVDRLAAKYFGSYVDESWPWINKASAFCLWGPSHLTAFHAKGPQLLPKTHVVGHPRFDNRCRRFQEVPRSHDKLRIGLITRFTGINPYDQGDMLSTIYFSRKIAGREHPIFRLSPELDIEDRIYTEALDARLLFQFIDELKPNIEKYELNVRVHPRENRLVWEKMIRYAKMSVKLAPWDQPFMHWLNEVDCVIGPVSTSYYDCVLAGKKPISTFAIVPHRDEHILKGGDDENRILDFVHQPKSMAEIMALLSEIAAHEPLKISDGLVDLLRQEVNYPDCSNSLLKLAQVCNEELDRNEDDQAIKNNTRRKFNVLSNWFAFKSAFYTAVFHRKEQSSSFALTWSRKRWIDSLVSSNEWAIDTSLAVGAPK